MSKRELFIIETTATGNRLIRCKKCGTTKLKPPKFLEIYWVDVVNQFIKKHLRSCYGKA